MESAAIRKLLKGLWHFRFEGSGEHSLINILVVASGDALSGEATFQSATANQGRSALDRSVKSARPMSLGCTGLFDREQEKYR